MCKRSLTYRSRPLVTLPYIWKTNPMIRESGVTLLKYLGVCLSNYSLLDDDDILRLVRLVYGAGNKVKYRFFKMFN